MMIINVGEDAIFFKQNYFKFIIIPYYSILEYKDGINLLLNIGGIYMFLMYFLLYCALHLFK